MKAIDGQLLCAVRVPREKVLAACLETEASIVSERQEWGARADALVPEIVAHWRRTWWSRLFERGLSDDEIFRSALDNTSWLSEGVVSRYRKLESLARHRCGKQLKAVRQIRAAVQSSPDQEIWLSNEAIANLGGPLL